MYKDPDGNKVPVPHGFTVSGAESEKYVNHNVEMRGTWEELTFHSEGDYPWTQNNDGVWQSGNYNVANSTSALESDEFTVGEDGGYLNIEWCISSQARADLLSIEATNIDTGIVKELTKISGTNFGTNYNSLIYTKYNVEFEKGTYLLTIKYSKNSSSNVGLDSGYLKHGAILKYNDTGESTVIIHKYGGFVIYEGEISVANAGAWTEQETWNASINKNQFVWVPVTNLSRIYSETQSKKKISKLWSFNTNNANGREPAILKEAYDDRIRLLLNENCTKDIFYKELITEFSKTIDSIKKYGGFYIGRYETGNILSNTPVVKRLNSELGNVNWYTAYTRMKNISTNKNIHTSMIWGCLWDETLQWFIDTNQRTQTEIAICSDSWGNYIYSDFEYHDGTGIINKSGIKKIPTGSTERNKSNNIYDMAGNIAEWTLEASDNRTSRIMRGGSALYNISNSQNTQPVSYRYNATANSDNYRYGHGCRAFFYI